MSKLCPQCGVEQHSANFFNREGTEDGLYRICKRCCKVNRALEGVRARDKRSKISYRQRHRAKTEGVECDDDISLVEVFRRDNGVCRICEEWVPPGKASMDHIKPITKGGAHVWDNIQLTHYECNLRKGVRTEFGKEQLEREKEIEEKRAEKQRGVNKGRHKGHFKKAKVRKRGLTW